MITVKYRDVLWGCAYRIGLNPAVELLDDQADALASYINGWMRRLYDAQDWPEWTKIIGFEVDGATNLVPYTLHLDSHTAGGQIETIGRVFGVYLLDPRTTRNPFQTPHRLTPDGIWCGYDHGGSVFIKYIPQCPQFTSTPWESDLTYGKGDLVYLPQIGECYKSRSANNVGHDPSGLVAPPSPLTTEITQLRTPDNAGTSVQHRIIDVKLQVIASIPILPDPPPDLSQFYIPVVDSTGLLTAAVHTANGVETLSLILADLASQLTIGLPSFTITTDIPNLTIRIDGPQDFWVSGTGTNPFYVPNGGPLYRLTVKDIQAFVATSGSTLGDPQLTKITMTQDNVMTGADYNLVVTDSQGVEHAVSYTALATDSASQILAGLTNAMSSSTDVFFETVSSTLDLENLTLTISVRDQVSVDASMSLTVSSWWDIVQFQEALADQVIRGVVADVLREEGQTDRADAEEQKVPTEMAASASSYTTPDFLPLTDQQKPKSRFSVK
jgi:hypothetical protein